MHTQMPRYAGLRTKHIISQPCVFVDVQHGLCNRLRAMASGYAVARATGRRLVVIWVPDHHCEARIGDLLKYDGPVIEDAADAAQLRDMAGRVYNYMEIEQGAVFQEPVLPDTEAYAGQDVYIRSAYSLTSPHCDMATEQQFLWVLRPTAEVLDLVQRVERPSQVAAHIRMATGEAFDSLSFESPNNWPAERHAELTEWRAKSNVWKFVTRLDALVAEGRADSIFVATDLAQTYDILKDRYGARLRYLERRDFDRSAQQLVYALADLLLLTAAPHFLASTWSSFSDMAQRLASPRRLVERSGYEF